MPPKKTPELKDEKKWTDEQMIEFKEAFALFDKDKDSQISVGELGAVMRALGLTPSEPELAEMIASVDKDGNGKLDFNEFVALITTKGVGEMDAEDVRGAFRVFDKDAKGFISEADLKHILTDIGDKFSANEFEQMSKLVKAEKGQVNYEAFIKLMMESYMK